MTPIPMTPAVLLAVLLVLAGCSQKAATDTADNTATTTTYESAAGAAASPPAETASAPAASGKSIGHPLAGLSHLFASLGHVDHTLEADIQAAPNKTPAPAPPPPPAAQPDAATHWNLKYNGPDSLPYNQQKQISLVIETHGSAQPVFDQTHPGPVIADTIAKFPFAVATLVPTSGVADVVAESDACQQVTTQVNPRWDWGVTATTDKPFTLRLKVDQVSACKDSAAITWTQKDYTIRVNASWWQKALIWADQAKVFLLAVFAFIVAAGGAIAAVRKAFKKSK
jgi:hypothetical protein